MFKVVLNTDKLVPKSNNYRRPEIELPQLPIDEAVVNEDGVQNIGGFDVVVEPDDDIVINNEEIIINGNTSYIPSQIPRRIPEAPNVTIYSNSGSRDCGCNKHR